MGKKVIKVIDVNVAEDKHETNEPELPPLIEGVEESKPNDVPIIEHVEEVVETEPVTVEQPKAKANARAKPKAEPVVEIPKEESPKEEEVKSKSKQTTCPKCGKTMTLKAFRYTHESRCTGGVQKEVKRRVKPTPTPTPAPTPVAAPAPEPTPTPVRARPAPISALEERYNRILAKKESYKKLTANAF